MIYIFTALYSEAHCMIRQFHLTKILENTHFQQFSNESEQILLTVCGVGEIAAATAVSSVCTKYPPARSDFLLNVGSCGCAEKQTGVFLIHKLIEQATGKTFYPDILFRHEFDEATLVTNMVPWKNPEDETNSHMKIQIGESSDKVMYNMRAEKFSDKAMYDMEAAAIYQSGSCFFAPYQMIFLKVISDSGESVRLSDRYIKDMMECYKEKICAFIRQLMQITKQESMTALNRQFPNEHANGQWFHNLCADLRCSKAMEDSLSKYLHYAALAGIDYKAAVQRMYEEKKLPCKDKKEGKKRFEEFKQQLL